MEHRWGERVGVDIPVRVAAQPFMVRDGRMMNLSVSGASLKANCELRPLSVIHVVIELAYRSRSEAPSVAAYVARVAEESVGIEWCEFAPPVVNEILQAFTARPYAHKRTPEPSLATAFSRLSTPLLKHGT